METPFNNSKGGYSHPELEHALEAEHRQVVEQAKLKGAHFARLLKPSPKGDSLVFYISDFTAKYDTMIALVRQKIQSENASIDAQMLTAAAEDKSKKLHAKRQEVQTEQYNLELQLKQDGISLDDIDSLKPKKQFFAVLAAIGICEIAFNAGAFQILGDTLLFSILISLGVTGALFYLAKHLAQYLKENSAESRKKTMVVAGTVILAMGIFYLLAKLRSEYLNEESEFHISPILLVFVNILFFAVTAWHYYRNTVLPEEKQRYEKLMKYKNQLYDLKRQYAELEKEIEDLKQDTAGQLRTLLHKPEYVKWLCQKITRWKTEAIESFKASNLAGRSDRQCPDCFLQTTEPNDSYYQTTNS